LSADKAPEQGPFIELAHHGSSAFAETDVAKSAVNVEGVEIVFES
jgi:hypothetical protein